MKIFKILLLVLLLVTMILPIYSQENTAVPKRTPEQEATKQTEKLQQELNLNQDQTNQIYEINLHYARERQVSNKRSEALFRMKNKNAEIKQVLSPEQNEKLQNKRYERTYFETNILNHNQSINSSDLRSTSNVRSNQTNREPVTSEMNSRNNFRPVNPNFRSKSLPNQTSRRSATIRSSSNLFQHNPSFQKSSLKNPPNSTRRNEMGVYPHSNALNTRTRITPPNSPRRIERPANQNRK